MGMHANTMGHDATNQILCIVVHCIGIYLRSLDYSSEIRLYESLKEKIMKVILFAYTWAQDDYRMYSIMYKVESVCQRNNLEKSECTQTPFVMQNSKIHEWKLSLSKQDIYNTYIYNYLQNKRVCILKYTFSIALRGFIKRVVE